MCRARGDTLCSCPSLASDISHAMWMNTPRYRPYADLAA